MNGRDSRTSRGRVFVSYAHDPEGRRLAAVLCAALRARVCDVASDHDLLLLNPPSLAAWMDEQIEDRVVLCVLSDGYLRAFAEAADGEPARRGVRYELRAIRQRIYDHRGHTGCPVIPVATPSFTAESAPNTMRALGISRLDPDTEFGIDQLIERIVALEGTGDDDAMKTQEPTGPGGATRTFRQVMYDLQAADPGAKDALELVREGLRLVSSELAPELLGTFPLMAGPIKVHGDASLMHTLTTACLRALRCTPHLLPCERAWEPRVLICGTGWCLQREHHLPEALEETQRGVHLAERYQDLYTAALGKKCIGGIRRLLAEDARGQDREYHLRAGIESLDGAVGMYSAIERNGARCSEVGSCLCLRARLLLTWYRLLKDKHVLRDAADYALQADDLLASCQATDRYELATLRAEIAAAKHRYVDARAQLGEVIESLIAKPDAIYQEILANAYMARAHVTQLASRGPKDGAMRDLRNARDIFADRNYEYAVASCEWAILKVNSKSVTSIKITSEDVLQLEELTPDPRMRLRAVAELKRQSETRIGNRPSGRKVNWENIVRKVAHTEPGK